MPAAYYVCATVTLVSALVSLGYSLAAAISAGTPPLSYARYALVRSAALAIACAIPLVYHSNEWLYAVALSMILVQAGDALVGIPERTALKIWGPALTSVINLAALMAFRQ